MTGGVLDCATGSNLALQAATSLVNELEIDCLTALSGNLARCFLGSLTASKFACGCAGHPCCDRR